MGRPSNSEDERRRGAYEASPNDVEAARRIGLTPGCFTQWRTRRGLPPKTPSSVAFPAAEVARRRRAYEASSNDREAAQRLGLRFHTFRAWRARRGWPLKKTRPGTLTPTEVDRRRGAYEATPNDREAARRVGLVPATFRAWRAYQGWPPKESPRLSDVENDRRRHAYEQTATDQAAARLLGVSRDAFREWRRRAGLPARAPGRGGVSAIEEARRRRVYERTSDDGAAARILEIRRQAFRGWRHRRGLSPKHRRGGRALTRVEERRRRTLYGKRLPDAAIGRRLHVAEDTILRWRWRNGLSAHHARSVGAYERRRRIAAYWASRNDRDAARRLGLTPGAFLLWRRGEGLPSKRVRIPLLSAAEHARRLDAYRRTRNDVEAARLLRMAAPTFAAWRICAGLPSRSPRGPRLSPAEERRRHRLYWSSPTDAAAARAIGLTRAGYEYWRRTRELPPRHPVHRLPPHVIERRKRGIQSSRTAREAADRLGVTPPTIVAWARRYGVAVPDGPYRARRPRARRPGPGLPVHASAA